MGKGSPTLRGAAGDEGLTGGVRAGGLGRMAGPAGFVGREGRTNPQIGAELYISTSTASVHVSNILRKLGVSSRVQAAAIAERAGLLHSRQP